MHTTYKTVNSFLVTSIPEFRPLYEQEMQKRNGNLKPYIAFAALNSMVVAALDFGADPSFLANVFETFEKMAVSGDPEIVALLQVAFLQDLVRYPKRLATAWELMGSETRKLTTRTARAWNREMNLPARSHQKAKAQAAS